MDQNRKKIILIDPLANELITVKDFQLICRVCLKKYNNLIPIAEYKMIKMITSCASVQISLNDELPKHLCQNCVNTLQNAFNFKQLVEMSDRNLRMILHADNLNRNFIIETDQDKIIGNCDDNTAESVKIESESKSEINIKNEFVSEDIKYDCEPNNKAAINKDPSKTCHICNKTFSKRCNLKYHMATHSDERPHQCSECGKTFKLYYALQTHIRLVHTNRRRFECDKCDKKYWFMNALRRHIRRAHDKLESNNLCDICGKNYNSPEGLKRHSLVHKSERPYQCTECNRSYKTISALSWHRRGIHLKTKNIYVKVTCQICGRLVSKAHLPNHLKMHEKSRMRIKYK